MAKEKAKHQYSLIANTLCDDVTKHTYNYCNTKGIELLLCETGFAINISVASLYDKDYMLASDSYLFPDPANPPIYSMINGDLLRTMPTAFSDDTVFNHLLNTPKSKYDKRIASLFAFLYSKSKEYATERFIYLWTAFNGMYSYLSEFVARANNMDKIRRENKQIIAFQQYFEIGKATIADDDKSRIAGTVISILKNLDISQANKEKIENSEISTRIKNTLKTKDNNEYDLTAYGYLLTQLSYYFRCKIIHGTKPVLLYAYADDRELHSLQIINALLEEFIDNNMPLLFDDKYIDEVIIPKAQQIEI